MLHAYPFDDEQQSTYMCAQMKTNSYQHPSFSSIDNFIPIPVLSTQTSCLDSSLHQVILHHLYYGIFFLMQLNQTAYTFTRIL